MRSTSHRVRFVAAIMLPISLGVLGADGQAKGENPSAPEALACRAIESKTASVVGARVVIFHQADSSDRDQLGAFLKEHDGSSVQFQTPQGSWQEATVFRLRTCFGRGLLVFPAGRAALAEGDRFLLRLGAGAKR